MRIIDLWGKWPPATVAICIVRSRFMPRACGSSAPRGSIAPITGDGILVCAREQSDENGSRSRREAQHPYRFRRRFCNRRSGLELAGNGSDKPRYASSVDRNSRAAGGRSCRPPSQADGRLYRFGRAIYLPCRHYFRSRLAIRTKSTVRGKRKRRIAAARPALCRMDRRSR